MNPYTTDQERFWEGEFGDAYVDRSMSADVVASRTALWSRILESCKDVASVTELGANVGLNLRSLRTLLPDAELTGVEINRKAAAILRDEGSIKVLEGSLLELVPETQADLAFTCGVLIHIHPDRLETAYDQLARASRRYVVVCEYYNPTPVEVVYRGHEDRLFKRDFAGEFLDAHTDFDLKDYGFVYHRDPVAPADDITWFLMERASGAQSSASR